MLYLCFRWLALMLYVNKQENLFASLVTIPTKQPIAKSKNKRNNKKRRTFQPFLFYVIKHRRAMLSVCC